MRIIGGQFRGRKFQAPTGMTTRPITDRVKESLFNILTGYMESAQVADLFCGTGSLGLEALSRGAERVYFADRDKGALRGLEANIDALGANDRSTILRGDIVANLDKWTQDAGKLDVVFLDPPYPLLATWVENQLFTPQIQQKIFTPLAAHLASDGVVVLRSPKKQFCPQQACEALKLGKSRDYGSMSLHFYTL